MAWPILIMKLEEKYRKWPGAKRMDKNGNAFEVVSLLAGSHWPNNRTDLIGQITEHQVSSICSSVMKDNNKLVSQF